MNKHQQGFCETCAKEPPGLKRVLAELEQEERKLKFELGVRIVQLGVLCTALVYVLWRVFT